MERSSRGKGWGRAGRACLETLRGLVWWERDGRSGDSRGSAQGGVGGGGEGEGHFLQGLMGEESCSVVWVSRQGEI